jgi:hypothetical protein
LLPGLGAADSPCLRLGAPVSGGVCDQPTPGFGRLSPDGRKGRSHDQQRDFEPRLVANALSRAPNGRRASFCLYLGTLDARKASVVPKRPLNLQIWTTDAEDASVVQKHIYPLVAWPTTQAGAPARAASTKALAAASKPPARKPRGNRWRAARLDPLLPRRQPALAAHPNVQEHGRPGPIGPPGQRDLVDLVVGHG